MYTEKTSATLNLTGSFLDFFNAALFFVEFYDVGLIFHAKHNDCMLVSDRHELTLIWPIIVPLRNFYYEGSSLPKQS